MTKQYDWKIIDGQYPEEYIIYGPSFNIAFRTDRKTSKDWANAKLIAAAPKMYATLLKIADRDPLFRNSDAREMKRMALEALKKVEGE